MRLDDRGAAAGEPVGRQHDLEHVPVGDRARRRRSRRQLEAERLAGRICAATRSSASASSARRRVNSSSCGSWPQADGRGDVGQVVLAARRVDVHAVGARCARRPAGAAARRAAPRPRVQHQAAAFGAGDVLVGVEAEGDQVAEGCRSGGPSQRAPIDCAASSIDAQAVPRGDRVEPVQVDRQAGQVDRNDRARARRDGRLERVRDRCCACADRHRRTPGARRRRRSRWRSRPSEIGVVMTSSPGPMPATRSAISIVAVPLAKARTGRPPNSSDSAASNSRTFGPEVIQPGGSTSPTRGDRRFVDRGPRERQERSRSRRQRVLIVRATTKTPSRMSRCRRQRAGPISLAEQPPGGERVDDVAERQHRIGDADLDARQRDDPDHDADDVAAEAGDDRPLGQDPADRRPAIVAGVEVDRPDARRRRPSAGAGHRR